MTPPPNPPPHTPATPAKLSVCEAPGLRKIRHPRPIPLTYPPTPTHTQAKFTEFETPGLCKILPVFASHDHFDMALWDDVADAITYCNHYLSAGQAALPDIAATFAAFAKYEVRGTEGVCVWGGEVRVGVGGRG